VPGAAVVSSRPRGSNYLEHGLHRIDRKVTPKVRLQHYLPVLRRLQASDYALVLPRQLVEKFDVTIRELPFELASPGLLLYWHRNTDQDPANSWFRSLIIGLYGPDAN
jgi:DNA-binding transcriptional LysR family regulator